VIDNPCYGAALVLNRRGYSVVPAHLSALRKDGTYLHLLDRHRLQGKASRPPHVAALPDPYVHRTGG
jgi:hypothetical protein